jgi:hypothetical protein
MDETKDSEEYDDHCYSFTTVTLGVSHTEYQDVVR